MSAEAGAEVAGRAQRLAGELAGLGLDALIVDSLIDIRYLTGFSGSSALAVVFASGAGGSGAGASGAGGRGEGQNGGEGSGELGDGVSDERRAGYRFLTDFRYQSQAAAQVPAAFSREIVSGDLFDAFAASLGGAGGRIGFDDASVTVKQHTRLQERLPQGWEAVACTGPVARLRAVKDAAEIAHIRAASELADEALRGVLEGGLAGRTERDVALELETRMRRLGADAPSFPSIVASGAHGARPHAEPRAEPIARDVLVTIDWGALHEGYCSDCTRTYASGEGISELDREIYALVLDAQERGLAAVSAGRTGKEVDALARAVIAAAGHGEHFGHGLGHGVGMEIHEGPRLSRTGGDEPLLAGNVVTVEPGVYLPGQTGVRIEDLVVVGEDGREVLTGLAKELTVVS